MPSSGKQFAGRPASLWWETAERRASGGSSAAWPTVWRTTPPAMSTSPVRASRRAPSSKATIDGAAVGSHRSGRSGCATRCVPGYSHGMAEGRKAFPDSESPRRFPDCGGWGGVHAFSIRVEAVRCDQITTGIRSSERIPPARERTAWHRLQVARESDGHSYCIECEGFMRDLPVIEEPAPGFSTSRTGSRDWFPWPASGAA